MSLAPSTLDSLTEQLYTSSLESTRSAANDSLISLSCDDSFLSTSTIETSSSPYTLMFLSQIGPTIVRRWIQRPAEVEKWSGTAVQFIKRVCLRVCALLEEPNAPKFLVPSLLRCCSRCTKLLYDQFPTREGHNVMISTFVFSANTVTALEVLNSLVVEFNLFDSSRASTFMTFAQHRRASGNFRDAHLLTILGIAVRSLEACSPSSSDYLTNRVSTLSCQLIRTCLCYDFMAIIIDETEEAMTSQIPSSWKETVLNEQFLGNLWRWHSNAALPSCTELAAALTSLISVRRSFFDTTEERQQWLEFHLSRLCESREVIATRVSVNPAYCNAVAEMILRFIPPFGYKDLIRISSFPIFGTFVAEFSKVVFAIDFDEEGSFNTTVLLMTFWSRMVSAKKQNLENRVVPSLDLGSQEVSQASSLPIADDIEMFIPELIASWIQARVRSPNARCDWDDDCVENVISQCDLLANIMLCDPAICVDGLRALLHEHLQQNPTWPAQAWSLMLASSTLRTLFPSSPWNDHTAPIFSRFLALALHAAERVPSEIEWCVVAFIKSFVSVFCTAQLRPQLQAILNWHFADRTAALQFAISKLGAVVVHRTNVDASAREGLHVLRSALDLMLDVCRETPQNLLRTVNVGLPPVHTLPFAMIEGSYKLRTNLYAVLFQIQVPDPYTPQQLLGFLAPIDDQLKLRGSLSALAIAGVFRDLRGVCRAAASSHATFCDFVAWILMRDVLFLELCRESSSSHPVVFSILRFIVEVVTPARFSGRVMVPSSSHSPIGLQLVRFLTSALQTLLQGVVCNSPMFEALMHSASKTPDDVPSDTVKRLHPFLKLLSLSIEALRKCISGDFCPFGAMAMYEDRSFDNTVCGCFRLLLPTPVALLVQYPKILNNLAELLKELVDMGSPIAMLSGEEIVSLVQIAIQLVLNTQIQTQTLVAVLTFLTFVVKLISTPPLSSQLLPWMGVFREAVSQPHCNVLENIMQATLQVVRSQSRALASASAALYPLFLSLPEAFSDCIRRDIAEYPDEKRAAAHAAYQIIFKNLDTPEPMTPAKHSDQFFSNLSAFRSAVQAL